MHSVVWHTCQLYLSNKQTTMSHNVEDSTLQHTDCCNFQYNVRQWNHLLSTVTDVCSAAGGHSAGCRTLWVCLQHHATVVTSNGVTICGSKFPPTVSKHCQRQHSTIPKTIPAIPAVVISKVLYPQSNIMAAFVRSHSNLSSDVSPDLITIYSYIQYGLFLQTPSNPRTKCPTPNIQQHILIPQLLTSMRW
jgi:hypothetical protein